MSKLYFKLIVPNSGQRISSQHQLISSSVSENNINPAALQQIKETSRGEKQKKKLSGIKLKTHCLTLAQPANN